MLKLNRTTEYALLALSYIRSKDEGSVASAREISQHFDLPFEILAKTLQRLKEHDLITSTYGTRGGYVLAKDLNKVSLADFLYMMEGPAGIVSCTPNDKIASHSAQSASCEYSPQCTIKHMMSSLNDRMLHFLQQVTLEELTRNASSGAPSRSSESSIVPIAAAGTWTHGEEP